ncbi:carotenoid oxygenase family protein [Synechococcus sp. Nb3U1]|uniref:carotenoid oxygenase family protein n=1 Tax=Synechococcus sp. Nb3U1 TaxID=1914529 RepID=UPI001F3E999A|nr:carotenoid oxygenase family protein [Synechococcus sp. Nb3U1]MCF2969754.1 carotenoid oxygenase family protein [Synechococcus sp. Nb3U1]
MSAVAQQVPLWSLALAKPGREFGPTELILLSGSIPPGLQGSLYRNGPGRLQRGDQRVGHWFDGDGAILAVHFRSGQATGLYRYVQTAGYQAEEQAGRYLFGGYGMRAKRLGQAPKNAANTSVLALPDRLLALWEAGAPHQLDPTTLTTRGLDSLGQTRALPSYSAHPKRDPLTGDIYNFGVELGQKGILHLYRSNAQGQLQAHTRHPLPGLPFIHDFVLAGRYLVFLVPPVRLNPWPVLATLKSYSDSLRWDPNQPSQVWIFDRETLQFVSRNETDPAFQWHFGNGYEDQDGSVIFTQVRYPDFATNRYLAEVVSGQTQTAAIAFLWQMRVDPLTGQVLQSEPLLERGCEFPIVDPAVVGQPHRHLYLLLHRHGVDPARELFSGVGRVDVQTGSLLEADLGAGRYPSEPLYAPDAEDPGRGWLLSLVFDGHQNRSQVWIWDAAELDGDPCCRLELPEPIPLGFHGTWRAYPPG